MSYILGLDLGTTTTTAALNDGTASTVFTHTAGETAIPSVVALDDTGSFLVGDAAVRHGVLDPTAVAREFKRRFGDPTPILLRGTPVAANELMLHLATMVVDEVSGQVGERPDRLVVCHPANWGQFKVSLLDDTLTNSALPPHDLVSEPQAAAIHYAGLERVAVGSIVAVYDLGGGTFDAAVLRKTPGGWEMLGSPGGVERLGGIDFDAALFHQVLATAAIDLDGFDDAHAATQLAVARLREACSDAKRVLSSETATTVAVSLPGIEETVRVTRAEFEAAIDPLIARSLEALDITLAKANVTADQLDRVLLVGGSSRIPLIAQRLASHTGRPLTTDSHPKHAIALGAAAMLTANVEPTPVAPETLKPASEPELEPAESEPIELPKSLGTNFPAVPSMSDEPEPEFLTRRRAAPSTPEALGPPTLAVPALDQPTIPTPPSIGAVNAATSETRRLNQPPATTDPARTDTAAAISAKTAPVATAPLPPAKPPSRWPFLVAFLVVLMAIAGAFSLYLQQQGNDQDDSESAINNSTTSSVEGAPTTSAVTSTTLIVDTDCPAALQPKADTNYRVVQISADDADGGLNGRAAPDPNGAFVMLFSSLSPVKVTGNHCALYKGNAWWGVTHKGELVWVAARFLEEL
ncbi:MAG: molecular chaperone DnaK [Acidimicrobiales bacterium]